MKNILCCLCLLSCSVYLSAQEWNINLQEHFYMQPKLMKITADNEIVVGSDGYSKHFTGKSPYLALISKVGNLKWAFSDFANHGEINDIVLTDEYIIAVGSASCCCDVGGRGFIYKFDYQGNI